MTPLTKHYGELHWHDGREHPVERYEYYLVADVEAVLKEFQDHDAALRQQITELTQERDEAVRIAIGLITWADSDVQWANERLAAQQHQEGLP